MAEMRGHVLVVDDEPMIVDLVGVVLSQAGYETSAARDGPAAAC